MKWVVWGIVGFLVLCFLGVTLGGLAIQQRAIEDRDYYSGAYPAPYGGYRSGPEWDKLTAAEQKGPDGYKDMQALMLSSEVDVAFEASNFLVRRETPECFDLFFEQIPQIDAQVKDRLRSGWYNRSVVVAAAKAVKDQDPKTKDGARTFLNLCYMRDTHGDDDAFRIVASAIPDYTGKEADDLAYTVGLFRPQSHQPLIDLLDHPEARVRKTAVAALGKMEAKEALAQVQRLKNDPSTSVRTAAKTAESSINAAIAYTPPSVSSPGEYAMQSERSNARKRLGMP